MIVDAHMHIWDPSRVDYPWMREGPLNRRFDVDELADEHRAARVDAVVLVQAADTPDDTQLMLEAAAHHPIVSGVVSWMPLDKPDELAAAIAEHDSRVVGVRALIHERSDPDWIISDADAGLGVLSDAGMPYDFVTGGPAALALLPVITNRHPDLRVVIDHLGKPPIGGSDSQRARWRALLATASRHPHTHAKLSGFHLLNGAPASAEEIRPFVEDALELFGPSRLMIGSDWPISLSAGGFTHTWTAVLRCLSDLDASSIAEILGLTAVQFYRLQERTQL